MWKCKICGCENTDSNATCRMCKAPMYDKEFVQVSIAGTSTWKCKICGCENPNSSTICKICKTPVPLKEFLPVSSADNSTWKCKICGCTNPSSQEVCRICNTPAPGQALVSTNTAEMNIWKCKTCGCENPNSSNACRICKAPVPDEMYRPVNSAGTEFWKCKICGCENPYSSAICRICKTPMPDEVQSLHGQDRADMWKCKVCGCENPNSCAICRVCKTSAPGKSPISDVPGVREPSKKPSPSRLRTRILVAVASVAIVLLVVGISDLTGFFAAGSNETNQIVEMGGENSPPQTIINNSNDALSLLHTVDDPDNGTIPEFEYDGEEFLSSGTGKVYRFNQTYKGIPIYGVQRVVSVDGRGKALYVAGDSIPGLEINMPSDTMSYDAASSILLESLGLNDTVVWNDGTCWFFEPNSGSENAYHLVYEIGFSGINEDGQHISMTALTDAKSGEIYRVFANNYTVENMTDDAKYNKSTFSTLYSDEAEYGSTGEGVYILKDTDRGITILDTDDSDLIKTDDKYVFRGAYKYFTDTDNDWNEPDGNKDVVKLYQNLQASYDYYTKIDPEAKHSPIVALVGAQKETAWIVSEYFSFTEDNGDVRCLDVAGHEVTHFIIGDNLHYFDMPGALHESFADIMGALIENKSGEAFLSHGEDRNPDKHGKTIVRTLDSSNQDAVSNQTISNMRDYTYGSLDQGYIHRNCGIPSMAFVYMSDYGRFDKAFSRQEIIQLYYNTMKSLYADTEFWGARSLMLIECEKLSGKASDEYRSVQDAWDKVGVTEDNRDELLNWPHQGNERLFVNYPIISSIDYQGDFDCIKFIPSASGEYTFNFDHVDTLALNCYVLDSGMNVLGNDENITTPYDLILTLSSNNLNKYKELLSDVPQLFSDNKITVKLEQGEIYFIVIKGYKKIGEYIVSAKMTVDETQEQQNTVEVPTATPNSIQTPSSNIAEETQPDVKKPQTGSPVNIEEQSIYYDNEYVSVQITYPQLSGLLDKGLEEQINADIVQEMHDAINSSEQASEEEESDYPYSVEASYEVGRNDGAFISIYLNVYCESGGAHGEEYSLYYNMLNTNPGARLSIPDLFIDGSDYISVLNKEILKLIDKDPNLSQENYFTTITENQDFYLTDNELVITFPKGDISAYIEDQPEFRIPLTEISSMVVSWLK